MTVGDIAAEYEERLTKDIDKVSQKLYDILLREIAKFTVNGKLTADKAQLAILEETIRQSLVQAGYTTAMNEYFGGFPKVVELNEGYYQKQGISITPMLGDSQLIEEVKSRVTNDLRGAGMNRDLVRPLAELLREGALLNRSYQEAADSLKNALIEKAYPTRYVVQVSKDAISMYDGAIQDEIRIRFKATRFYYVVGLKETSRPFCVHMKEKFGSKPITDKQLKKALDEYCPNGQPSQEEITFTTVNGVTETKKKGSGMMENTFVDNFGQKRGGYQCRHDVRWIIE